MKSKNIHVVTEQANRDCSNDLSRVTSGVECGNPNVTEHNNLSGIQGGNSTERYHLSKAQYQSLLTNITPTLQKVMEGGNTSTYALQITDLEGINLNTPSVALGTDEDESILAHIRSGIIASAIRLHIETSSIASASVSGRLSLGANAVNNNEAVTLGQLITALPNLSLYQLKTEKGQANGYVPLNSSSLIPSVYLPATSLQSVTTGAGNNITSNALQISGGDNFNLSVDSLLLLADPDNGFSQIFNVKNGAPTTGVLLSDEAITLSAGSNQFIINVSESPTAPKVRAGGRIRISDAINGDEATTLSQVMAILPGGGTLQSVTNGANNNKTTNAIQVTDMSQLDNTTQSTVLFNYGSALDGGGLGVTSDGQFRRLIEYGEVSGVTNIYNDQFSTSIQLREELSSNAGIVMSSRVKVSDAVHSDEAVTLGQVQALIPGTATLQSVTNGTGNNKTNNAIQITGANNYDPAQDGLLLVWDSGGTQIVNIADGAANGGIAISEVAINLNVGTKSFSLASEETSVASGASFNTRVNILPAVLTNDAVTLGQLNAAMNLQAVLTAGNIASKAIILQENTDDDPEDGLALFVSPDDGAKRGRIIFKNPNNTTTGGFLIDMYHPNSSFPSQLNISIDGENTLFLTKASTNAGVVGTFNGKVEGVAATASNHLTTLGQVESLIAGVGGNQTLQEVTEIGNTTDQGMLFKSGVQYWDESGLEVYSNAGDSVFSSYLRSAYVYEDESVLYHDYASIELRPDFGSSQSINFRFSRQQAGTASDVLILQPPADHSNLAAIFDGKVQGVAGTNPNEFTTLSQVEALIGGGGGGGITLGSPITGYTVGTDTALAETDTILQAYGKLQGQVNAVKGNITTINGDISDLNSDIAAITFENLAPTASTYGSIIVRNNAGAWIILAPGTAGQVLTRNTGAVAGLSWETPSTPDLSGLVPYTGATGNVNLGTNTLTAAATTIGGLTLGTSSSNISIGSNKLVFKSPTGLGQGMLFVSPTNTVWGLIESAGWVGNVQGNLTATTATVSTTPTGSTDVVRLIDLGNYVTVSGASQTISGVKVFTNNISQSIGTDRISMENGNLLSLYNTIDESFVQLSPQNGIIFNTSGIIDRTSRFKSDNVTAIRTLQVPDASGVLALVSDLDDLGVQAPTPLTVPKRTVDGFLAAETADPGTSSTVVANTAFVSAALSSYVGNVTDTFTTYPKVTQIVTLSQSDYDGLPVIDENTFYIIPEVGG